MNVRSLELHLTKGIFYRHRNEDIPSYIHKYHYVPLLVQHNCSEQPRLLHLIGYNYCMLQQWLHEGYYANTRVNI